MSMPDGMAGVTVACPHCKQPFKLPDIAPAEFANLTGGAPRPRVKTSAGSNPLIWVFIALPIIGVVLAVLVLSKGSRWAKSLDKGRLLSLYDGINNGMDADEAEKRIRAFMDEIPGELKGFEAGNDDDTTIQRIFEKGSVRIVLFVNRGNNQVITKTKSGF